VSSDKSNIVNMSRFSSLIKRSGLECKVYQEEGVNWCVDNEKRCKGGFIADEMGLGKTIMMIGVMYSNFMRNSLIIVPPILLEQWYLQIYRLTGHKSLIYHGKMKKSITVEELKSAPIVISTYNGLVPLSKTDISLLHQVAWSRLIFDEAHHLRNKNTRIYKCARALKSNVRWLVSGTPVQNNKKDFYALCCMLRLQPNYYMESSNLRDLAHNYILKRTKKQVGINIASLHTTNEIVVWKSQKEKELSEEIHSCVSFSRVNAGNRAKSSLVMAFGESGALPLLLRAKQSCVYPKLMMRKLDELVEKGQIRDSSLYQEGLSSSSKLDAVVTSIVDRKGNGCGKLVFCHFREEMDEIAERLQKHNMTVSLLDGRTSGSKRSEILGNAYDVLILQIQTGCEGLNLQENYSDIYFISPHWNPAVEDQAIARCHRIGQRKEVCVHRFQMESFGVEDNVPTRTIDKYVDDVQEVKRIIASEIIDPFYKSGAK